MGKFEDLDYKTSSKLSEHFMLSLKISASFLYYIYTEAVEENLLQQATLLHTKEIVLEEISNYFVKYCTQICEFLYACIVL